MQSKAQQKQQQQQVYLSAKIFSTSSQGIYALQFMSLFILIVFLLLLFCLLLLSMCNYIY